MPFVKSSFTSPDTRPSSEDSTSGRRRDRVESRRADRDRGFANNWGEVDESIPVSTEPSGLPRHPDRRGGVLHDQGAVRRGARRHAVEDRGAVLPRPAAARHRQRPDHHQGPHHPGRRRDHPPDRPGAHGLGQPGPRRDHRDLAVRRQRGLPPHRRQRREEGPAGQELPGVRPVHHRVRPASTASGRSSRSPTPAGPPPTSTSR